MSDLSFDVCAGEIVGLLGPNGGGETTAIRVLSTILPADEGCLDVLERQVVLDASADDLTAAADSLAQTNAAWARLKPFALQINGVDVAAQFDASLTPQATALEAGDVASLTAKANNGLDLWMRWKACTKQAQMSEAVSWLKTGGCRSDPALVFMSNSNSK